MTNSRDAGLGVMADSNSIDNVVGRSVDSLDAVQDLLAQNQTILQALQTQASATTMPAANEVSSDFNIKVELVNPKRSVISGHAS